MLERLQLSITRKQQVARGSIVWVMYEVVARRCREGVAVGVGRGLERNFRTRMD